MFPVLFLQFSFVRPLPTVCLLLFLFSRLVTFSFLSRELPAIGKIYTQFNRMPSINSPVHDNNNNFGRTVATQTNEPDMDTSPVPLNGSRRRFMFVPFNYFEITCYIFHTAPTSYDTERASSSGCECI